VLEVAEGDRQDGDADGDAGKRQQNRQGLSGRTDQAGGVLRGGQERPRQAKHASGGRGQARQILEQLGDRVVGVDDARLYGVEAGQHRGDLTGATTGLGEDGDDPGTGQQVQARARERPGRLAYLGNERDATEERERIQLLLGQHLADPVDDRHDLRDDAAEDLLQEQAGLGRLDHHPGGVHARGEVDDEELFEALAQQRGLRLGSLLVEHDLRGEADLLLLDRVELCPEIGDHRVGVVRRHVEDVLLGERALDLRQRLADARLAARVELRLDVEVLGRRELLEGGVDRGELRGVDVDLDLGRAVQPLGDGRHLRLQLGHVRVDDRDQTDVLRVDLLLLKLGLGLLGEICRVGNDLDCNPTDRVLRHGATPLSAGARRCPSRTSWVSVGRLRQGTAWAAGNRGCGAPGRSSSCR
jgi:hypothetical protein